MGLIGIDIGTSGVKVILLEADGRIAANVTEEYPVSRPYPLWSEQSPEDWWHSTCKAIIRALTETGIGAANIKGIGVSGQMVGLVVLVLQRHLGFQNATTYN